MNCFPCFQSQRSKKSASKRMSTSKENEFKVPGDENQTDQTSQGENGNIAAQIFTFRELATATKNFRQQCLLGEGGFGRVYKGMLQATGQVVAVKQLDRNGLQGNKQFLVEVLMLSLLHHQNLVNLIGYCADGDQRLLVYEFMPEGSVEDHLLNTKSEQKPLDWKTRMKIAFGAAQGLEYLHEKPNPPVIYRDLKSSNILLDEEFNPKLSDFGLAKLGPTGDKMPVQSRVMGTYGYCAPEYARGGHLTTKSDVYSFGVVLLELITGRRAIDTTKPNDEQNLVAWAQPIFRDPKKFPDMADPRLNKEFPEKSLNQAVAIAAMCLQDEAAARPLMSDVVTTLSFLTATVEEIPPPVTPPVMNEEENKDPDNSDHEDQGSEKDQSQESSDDEDGESEKDDEDSDENSSDYSDSDSSVYEDGESEDGHAESKKWRSKSSRKSSRRSQNRRASSDHKDSSDESVSSSEKSSRRSRGRSLKQKSTKKYFSLSRKSSKGSKDGSVSLSHRSSLKSSIFSLSHISMSSNKSQDGNASLSHDSISSSSSSRKSSLRHNSSKGSHDGRGSLSCKSRKRSHKKSIRFDHNSRGKSQDGDVCLEHNNSRGSHDGSVYSS